MTAIAVGLERLVRFRPAFDKRHADPNKNYGIHGVELHMVLKGPLGAVNFTVYTNWQLPHVTREQAEKHAARGLDARDLRLFWQPTGADVGYHSPTPHYESQTAREDCIYLDGRPCYYDGSALAAEPMLELLISKGDEAVWAALEERYNDWLVRDGNKSAGRDGVEVGL